MNKILSISALLFMCFFFSACEKVIDFDLAGAEEVIVIEATLTNTRTPFSVRVTKTSPYFGGKTDNLISGAKVSVKAEKGSPKYFEETGPGSFQLSKTTALVNYWYIVDVEYEGVTYSARSFLNEPVPIVELSFSYFDGFGIFDSGYKVSCYIRDPADRENFYRLKYYVNGKPIDDKGEISLYSDKLFNGKVIGLGHRSLVFQETDILTVELQSIDKATYDYFSTLETISGTDLLQTASPANPISNFNNGALGYFSAYSFDRKTVTIKDYLKKD